MFSRLTPWSGKALVTVEFSTESNTVFVMCEDHVHWFVILPRFFYCLVDGVNVIHCHVNQPFL